MLVDVGSCWVMRFVPDLYRDAGRWLDEGHAGCATGWVWWSASFVLAQVAWVGCGQSS
jgi:hypothetical protein